MADKKKVFSITINGLQESLDMVESLNAQLKELDKTIKAVEKRTIKIKGEVEVDTEKTKTVVSGKSSSGGTTDKEKEKELAIQKQITAEIKAQGQYQAALDESYRKGMQTIQQTKQDTKDMLSGAIDQAGQYTNTMAGWKAELRDLTSERNRLDITKPEDLERFREIQERANALTTILKTIEQETGNFRRNVGNYPQLVSSLNTELENTEKTIKTISDEMASTAAGSDRYNKLASELEIAQKHADDLRKKIGEVGQQIQSTPKFEVKVGDVTRQFDNARQASKALLQEYTKLVAEGKQDTKEANELAEAYGRVATATKNARGELQSYIGGAKGLQDTIEIMQGVASIGSLGAGLQGLFGGKNVEVDKSLQTFANLSLIMNGLAKLQESINDKTSIWGVTLATIWNWSDKILDKFGEVTGVSKLWDNMFQTSVAKAKKLDDEVLGLFKNFGELTTEAAKFDKNLSETAERFIDAAIEAGRLKNLLSSDDLNGKDRTLFQGEYKAQIEDMQKYRDEMQKMADAGDKTAKELLKVADNVLPKMEKSLKLVSGQSDSFIDKFTKMGKTAKGFGLAMDFAGKMVKSFAKATLILAAAQIAMELMQKAIDGIAEGWKVLTGKGGLEIEQQMQMVADNTELANKQLEKYIDTMNLAKNLGLVTELQAQGLAFKEIDKYILKAVKDFQDYIRIQKDLKDMPLNMQYNNSSIWGDDADIKNMEEFRKEWDILIKAVETGQDKIEAGSKKGWGWLLTSGDAVEELGDKTKAVLGDMLFQINLIDFKNPENAVKQFRKIADNELYQSALTQMHTLFPEEEWAKTLDRMYNNLSDFVDKSESRASDLAVAMRKANQELEDATRLSNINAIPDANKRQDELDKYNKEKRQKEINESVADETHKQKALEALDKEYEQKRKDRVNARLKSIKSSGVDEYNIFKQIRDNLLTLQKEGLDKEVQRLENQRADELHNAEKSGKKRGELIASINAKYDKIIEDKKAEWYKNQLKQRKAFDDEMIKMAQEAAAELSEIQNTASLNAINRGLEENENQNIKRTATISYDTSIDTSAMSFEDNDKLLEEQKKYYDELLKAQSEYIAKKTQLQLEESLENERQLKEQAEREYSQRLTSNKEWQDAQLEELDKFYKDGLIKEEEYNEKLAQLNLTFENSNKNATEAYQQKLSEATKNGEQERDNIVSEGRQEQQSTNAEANQNGIDAIQEYYNEIAEISEREQKANTNRHTGLFNYEKERERLEKVKAGYEKVMAGLEADYEKLKARYNAGDINFDQFQAAKKQIEDLKKAAEKSAEDTSESLSDLFQNYAQSVNDFASKIASQFQEMFSTFQNIQSLMLEAEQNQLDQEQEVLDKQKDAVEKAYEKQAAIVDKYKEAINGTEDELKNARGARREALIQDTIEQREAYLKETESLKRQELEKEKIAQKEKQLKKKQDDLEKKRKQQQQKASIVNATINTALGVTQALSAYPPPASYALAAAVGALGAVEIALIASQKYAKGGLIEGPDHAHGGVKVQTKKGIAEVEGNEYIVNKKTTTENLSLIEFVNSKKRRLNLNDFIEFYSGKAKYSKPGSSLKFADGGTMPELTDYSQMVQNQPVVVDLTIDSKVSTVDIINSIDRITQTRVLAGL